MKAGPKKWSLPAGEAWTKEKIWRTSWISLVWDCFWHLGQILSEIKVWWVKSTFHPLVWGGRCSNFFWLEASKKKLEKIWRTGCISRVWHCWRKFNFWKTEKIRFFGNLTGKFDFLEIWREIRFFEIGQEKSKFFWWFLLFRIRIWILKFDENSTLWKTLILIEDDEARTRNRLFT